MASRQLTSPYHRQDDPQYCGAACVQMVVAGLGGAIINQLTLYNENRSGTFNSAWASPPDGISNTLIRNDPRGGSHFGVVHPPTALAATQSIIATIENYRVPPIASVFDSSHWVVVYGYLTNDAAPAGTDPLVQLYVNNPYPEATPPIHHAVNDVCNIAGNHISDIIVMKDVWYREYMIACQVPDIWQNQFLAICDPLARPEYSPTHGEELPTSADAPLMSAIQASASVPVLLKKHSFYGEPMVGKLLRKLKPGKASLVMRLNRKNVFYYIVPMLNAQKEVMALVTVDAKRGVLNEVGISKDKQDNSHPVNFKPLTKSEILKAIGKYLDSKEGVYYLHKEVVTISPALVWRPCEESLSPFWPFHLVYIGEKRIYVRLDKVVFHSLSIHRKGL